MPSPVVAEIAPEVTVNYEARLLGSLLLKPEQLDDVREHIGYDDFTLQTHMMIFESIMALSDAKQPIHVTSVAENLAQVAARTGQVSTINLPFLQALENNAAPFGARTDARKLRERSAMRHVANAGKRVVDLATTAAAPSEAILEEITGVVNDAAEIVGRRGVMVENFVEMNVMLGRHVKHIEAMTENPALIDGIRLGIRDVDHYIKMLSPGYHIIGARPGMGKTVIAIHIALNANEASEADPKAPVSALFCSMEMREASMSNRILTNLSTVSSTAMRTGQVKEGDWKFIVEGLAKAEEREVFFSFGRNQTTADVYARVRRFIRAKKSRMGIVILDYLQLMNLPETFRMTSSSKNPLDYISKIINDMAKDEGLIVIALCQLNRKLETRINKRPLMSDLRESGQIEQDADSIWFLHREEGAPGVIEIINAKMREAEPNETIYVGFNGDTQSIFNTSQPTAAEKAAMREQTAAAANPQRAADPRSSPPRHAGGRP